MADATRWVPFWPRTARRQRRQSSTRSLSPSSAVCAVILLLGRRPDVGCSASAIAAAPAHRAPTGPRRPGSARSPGPPPRLLAFLGALCLGRRGSISGSTNRRSADLEVYVVGKQWMWKMEHPGGQREIDALHVPVGKTVRLVLASQDVIHSFFIPAFRHQARCRARHVRDGVVQGDQDRQFTSSNAPNSAAREHAHMRGDSRRHGARRLCALAQPTRASANRSRSKARHCSGNTAAAAVTAPNSTVHAPPLAGLYGRLVHLQDGSAVRADERYIRDLHPAAEQAGRRRLSAGHALLRRPARRGRSHEADRLHPIAVPASASQEARAMADDHADLPSQLSDRRRTRSAPGC